MLEGLVKASSKTQQVLIKPGQQAVLNLSNNRLEMSKADLETVMAWKNNDFLFKDEDLASVMKKVARWYNVDVIFKDVDPKSIKLVGLVSRSKNISAVLKIIESITDLKFKIEGWKFCIL